MPGLSPSTRPTSEVGVAVRGNAESIQLTRESYSEIPVLNVGARAELGRGAAPHHPPLLQHVVMIGQPRERLHVLVDEQDREPLGLEPLEAAPDLAADQR